MNKRKSGTISLFHSLLFCIKTLKTIILYSFPLQDIGYIVTVKI